MDDEAEVVDVEENDEECHDVWGKEVQVRLIMEWTKLKWRDRVSKWGGGVRRF